MHTSLGKVVVTGGSGYVGGSVASALARKGYSVVVYDRVEATATDSNISYVTGDICDVTRLSSAVSGAVGVIHCAGFGLSGASNLPAFDSEMRRVNVEGTRAVVRAAREAGTVRALGKESHIVLVLHI